MGDELQPYQLVQIYRESKHSRLNSWLFSGFAAASAIAGFGVALSNLPQRYPVALGLWSGCLILVSQASEATRQADRYQYRKDVLERASEDAQLAAIVRGVQPGLPGIGLGTTEIARPLLLPSGNSPLEAFAGAVQQLLAQDLDVRTDYVDAVAGPQLLQLQLRPHDLKKVKQLQGEAMADSVQTLLSLSDPPIISLEKGAIALSLPRPDRQFCHFDQFISKDAPSGSLRMAIGVDIRGELVEVELTGASLQHFVMGGAPRQGKSQTLLTMMGSLVYRYSPQQIRFIAGDGKGGVTLAFLNSSPYLLKPVATSPDQAVNLAEFLKKLVDDRYDQFRQVNAETIDDFNAIATEPLPYVGVFWDEFQELFDLSLGIKSKNLPVFESLSSLAPAAGVFIVWSSQRIDGRLLPPQINSKCLSRICLKVQKDADSKFVLNGDESGVKLLGKGDLLFDNGRELQRLQGLYIPHRDAVFRVPPGASGPVLPGANCQRLNDSVPIQPPIQNHAELNQFSHDSDVRNRLNRLYESSPNQPESPQFDRPFGQLSPDEKRDRIAELKGAGLNQNQIIFVLWKAKAGGNRAYQDAVMEFKQLMGDV